MNLFLFLSSFHKSTALSSRTVDGRRTYSGSERSVVGYATIGLEIPPTPSLIFTGGAGQKVRNLVSFLTSLRFEPPAFENAARYPNSETHFIV